MYDKVIYSNGVTMISVKKSGKWCYLWFVMLGEKPIAYGMTEESFNKMVLNLVDVANMKDE